MYVNSRARLAELLEERKGNRERIRQRINEFAAGLYGIEDFMSLVQKHFGSFRAEDICYGTLCRQVVSIMAEDVATYLACPLLGLRPLAMQFVRDVFIKDNPDKLRRIKLPWVSWSKKGNMVMRHERVVSETNEELQSKAFTHITTTGGETLLDYHGRLRRRVFGDSYDTGDVSAFWRDCMFSAARKPSGVYRLLPDGREEKVGWDRADPVRDDLRPAASWYYPLFCCLFLDGDWVLLETYEDLGNSAKGREIKQGFERWASILEQTVGYSPLVLQLPCDTKTMYYNRHLLDDGMSLPRCAKELAGEDNIPESFKKATDLVLNIGRTKLL
ncbi:MAG: hypothetical protein Q8P73_04845 [bacterium]|nr:hypothetical protein [bacterium]MDZ4341443.1 hypothetical protein [Candidatus Binatia bacterium]